MRIASFNVIESGSPAECATTGRINMQKDNRLDRFTPILSKTTVQAIN
jgi:hypothetical protein